MITGQNGSEGIRHHHASAPVPAGPLRAIPSQTRRAESFVSGTAPAVPLPSSAPQRQLSTIDNLLQMNDSRMTVSSRAFPNLVVRGITQSMDCRGTGRSRVWLYTLTVPICVEMAYPNHVGRGTLIVGPPDGESLHLRCSGLAQHGRNNLRTNRFVVILLYRHVRLDF